MGRNVFIFRAVHLFLLYIFKIGIANSEPLSNQECILPKYPDFGRYTVAGSTQDHKPGESVAAFSILQYSCDEGFFVTSNISFCHDGKWSAEPECSKRKVLCYYQGWSVYRKDEGKFDVEDINPMICTHLVFAFVGLSDEPGIKVRDAWNELPDNYGRDAFGRLVKLKEKNPNLKIMVAIGGWGEGSARFSQTFNTSENRTIFVSKTVDFLLAHGFDGLDIAWEFPGHNGGAPEDKDNYTELLKALKTAFTKRNLILAAVVAAPEYYMMLGYNVKEIGKYLDIIIIKTHDLHGSWDDITGIRSPLFAAKDEIGSSSQELNVDSSIKSWISYGAPAYKMVISIGLFGRTFNISSNPCKLPRCPSSGPGAPGKLTNEPGLLGYNEICLLEKDPTAVYAYDKEAMAPFIVKDNLWVSYDNKKSIEQKVNYVLYNKLGGVSLWSLDTDDFTGACADGKFPLTEYVYKTVTEGKPTVPNPKPYHQERKTPTSKHRNIERILVCYFASWSVYRKDDGKFDVEDIDPNLCTHLVYAFVGLTDDIGIHVRDKWNDLFDNYGKGAMIRFTKLTDKNPNLITLLAIGGYGEPAGKFSQSVDTPEKRNLFVQNSRDFLLKYGFDGLEIDWEFPGQRGGTRNDKDNFTKLLKALREEYDKHNLLLTALVAGTQVPITETYDVQALGKYLDFVNLKSFDMHGHWNSVIGHNSPLYGNDSINTDSAVKTWIKNGLSPQKLILGIPSYGRSYTLTSNNCARVGCTSKAGGHPGKWTNDIGILGYNEICFMERESTTVTSYDMGSKTAFLQKEDQWVSYDNKNSIQRKIDYIISNRLGGAMLYTVDTDDFKGACGEGNFPLITALNRGLIVEGSSKDPDACTLQDRMGCSTPEETSTEKVAITEMSRFESGCPLPEFPFGGQYQVGNYKETIVPGNIVPPYTLLAYSCKKNYIPSASIAFCQEDSTWSASPVCNRRCRMPQSFTVDFTCWDKNQNPIDCGEYVPSGTIVRYQCKHYHYSFNFYNYHMTCDDGSFDYPPPRCVPECGAEPSEGEAFIIEGISAKRGTFPWHVAIYQNFSKTAETKYEQICGGSLITTHLVISAAHCFYSSNLKRTNNPGIYAVGVGKFTRDWDGPSEASNPFIQKTKVKNIYLPISYGGDAQNHQSDIAIVELVTPIQFSDAVHPVCINLNNDDLNRHQLRTDSVGKVAGWGLTTEEGTPSDELKYLNVPVIDYNKCSDEMDKFNFRKYLTLDKICAGYTNGSAVCRGDSGGGLVFPHRDTTESVQRWYLRGIVSVGPKNTAQTSCRRDTYTAYTQVHYFKDWISNKFLELKV